MTTPHLLYLSLPTLFIDVESAETTLKTLRNRLCYHFRRAPRTMESHFSSYALMQLSSPHTHSPSPNTPPNLLLFILDLKSAERLESERSVTSGDRHSCQICDLSRSPSTISQLFAWKPGNAIPSAASSPAHQPECMYLTFYTPDMMSLTRIFLNH